MPDCTDRVFRGTYALPDDVGSSMNQNPHVHLRGPLGHLSLKAVTMMINFTIYSKVTQMNLTINNGLFAAENYI
jgi:hypothetical protein